MDSANRFGERRHVNGLDDLEKAIAVLALMLPRGYGLLLAIPPLMKAGHAWTMRLPIALALALPSLPFAYHMMPSALPAGQIAFVAVREFALGVLTGMFFLPLFSVPRAVGTFVDQQAGLMSVQLFDPTSTERSATVFADVFEQSALFMFVASGGFGALGELYAMSQRFWPVTEMNAPPIADVTDIARQGFNAMVDTAIRHAGPFVATLILVEYGIGLIGRAAPQLNILTTSVAIKLVFALVLIAIVGPGFTDAFVDAFHEAQAFAAQFLRRVEGT
ncbi:EscT/YscT/HrcT family type III secretion system export apparatus protein [Burkholderia sp. BDU5]|uniref:EscT/YscT/HrcT family type III secretion system export apparatus protein n=1 Tax=Burkholderia sp. BDU5 TaxID=1385590 RepID=UPI0022B1C14E|nr:flagellar biosynthetic protein FliR [Burkholderia sp. BDU5]